MKHPLSPLPALLALALTLTACAPAAPQRAATTETASAAERPKRRGNKQPSRWGHLQESSWCAATDTAFLPAEYPLGGR